MGNLIGLGIIHDDLILNKEMLNKLNYQTGYYLTKSLEILNIIYNSDKSYNSYFKIAHQQEQMKEDYEVHFYYVKNTTDADSLDMQLFWKKEKEKILEWWSRFYINRKNNVIDTEKKGFIVFNKEELQQIEAW